MFTQILAKFIVNTTYEDLPESVVAAAKRGVLDFTSVTVAGSCEPVVDKLSHLLQTGNYREESSVINGGFKTDAYHAAFINGAMAHILDYDDVLHIQPLWLGHPSVALLPAIFAVAEKENVSGKQLILAYCIGIEVYAKISLYCGDTPHKNGWHNTSYKGTMAAAAAVVKLLNLNEHQIRRAFGIAASLAGGLRQNFGTMMKSLHAGIAARNGVEAATLAEVGITSAENIFDAPLGFKKVFTGEFNEENKKIEYGGRRLMPTEFEKILGNPWNIQSPGLSFKVCPSCRATHFGMEAALIFREKYSVEANQVAQVLCHVPDHMESVLFYHDPQNGLEGKFSLEYVLARTLLDGIPKIADFTDERVNSAEIKGLIKKIKWNSIVVEEGTFGTPEFSLRLTDGRQFHSKIEFPRGEPGNPVNDNVLIEKFQDCADSILTHQQRDKVQDLIMNLESLDNVADLADLLCNA